MTADKISFTSRINFVDAKTFDKFRRGAYVEFQKDLNFMCAQNSTSPWFAKLVRPDIVKADEFFTDEVRTCTAGGVIDTKTGQCAGFHLFDCLSNFRGANKIIDNIFSLVPNPDRALNLGSKDLVYAEFSTRLFEQILEGLKSKIKDITVFKKHVFSSSESDLHYSLKDDTWTIHSMFHCPLESFHDQEVINPEALKKCFKEVKIADGDSLNFLS